MSKLYVDIYLVSNKYLLHSMEEIQQVKCDWSTHYKFIKFVKFSEHLIPKSNDFTVQF